MKGGMFLKKYYVYKNINVSFKDYAIFQTSI